MLITVEHPLDIFTSSCAIPSSNQCIPLYFPLLLELCHHLDNHIIIDEKLNPFPYYSSTNISHLNLNYLLSARDE